MSSNWLHQDMAIQKFKDKDFFGILFDCGTGKTRTAIKIAEEKNKPVLIIAPKNLVNQWYDAIKEHGECDSEILVVDSAKKNTKRFKERLDAFLKV